MGAAVAMVLLTACDGLDSRPEYPYDLPRADAKDVADVDFVGAYSGDTIDARLPEDNAPFKLQLADIMAPVRGQPWHRESVAALDALVKGKRARARLFESILPPEELAGEYDVTVIGRVYVGSQDINWELVGSGNAWVWEEKSNDPELRNLQAWARRHKKGLWALPESDREPPWEFMDRHLRLQMQEREESTPK